MLPDNALRASGRAHGEGRHVSRFDLTGSRDRGRRPDAALSLLRLRIGWLQVQPYWPVLEPGMQPRIRRDVRSAGSPGRGRPHVALLGLRHRSLVPGGDGDDLAVRPLYGSARGRALRLRDSVDRGALRVEKSVSRVAR